MKKLVSGLILFLYLIIVMSFQQVQAKEETKANNKKIGISAAIQTTQFDISLPIWASQNSVIAPSLGLAFVEDLSIDVALGLAYRYYYFDHKEAARPYLGFKAGFIYSKPETGDGLIDLIAGTAVGGEYFFSKNFSFGIEAQLNLIIPDKNSNRFTIPGKRSINTATVGFITIYF